MYRTTRAFAALRVRSNFVRVGPRTFSTAPATEAVKESVAALAANGEPTLSSLGLAHAYPSGWVQAVLEVVHVHGNLPWWAAIATTTLAARLLMFPLVVKTHRNMAVTNNVLPQMQAIQAKMVAARTSEEATRANEEMMTFYKAKGVRPFGHLPPMMANGAVFASMFFGIRGMASAPVESMRSGGMGWFADLTVADPILLLPFITASTLFVSMKLGADGVALESIPKVMRTFLKMMPFITFPVMCQFPAALNVYWLTTNVISIFLTRLVNHPAARAKLGIPKLKRWKPEDLPMDNFGLGGIQKMAAAAEKAQGRKG